MADREVPTRLAIDGVTAIGTASFATCAARPDGLYCWGSNTEGQLGNGATGGMVMAPQPSLLVCP